MSQESIHKRCLVDQGHELPRKPQKDVKEDKLLPFPAGSKALLWLSSGNANGNNCSWIISSLLQASCGLFTATVWAMHLITGVKGRLNQPWMDNAWPSPLLFNGKVQAHRIFEFHYFNTSFFSDTSILPKETSKIKNESIRSRWNS